MFSKPKSCVACVSAGRKIMNTLRPKKSFIELLINTIRKPRDSKDWVRPIRPPRTCIGCALCKIALYKKGLCWQEHLDRIKSL